MVDTCYNTDRNTMHTHALIYKHTNTHLLQYHSLRQREHLFVAEVCLHWAHFGASPDNVSNTSQLQASTHLAIIEFLIIPVKSH